MRDITEDNKIHLFLSYGHESRNARIIEILLHVLEEEFTVWIDKRNIHDHEDWRRAIVKGIAETDLTVGLLSEYSTRERGVCLDELGISISIPGRKLITILLDDQKSISVPSTITRNQWLDLSQWKEYIDTDRWDTYFLPKKEVLLAAIKSRENIVFQGEISRLYKILKPEDFSSKASLYVNSKTSVVRPLLIEKVEKWLNDPSSGRFLLITGNAGTGKSHFAAMYQHYNPVCAAGIFFEHEKVTPDYVKNMVRYLIYTLASKFPDYRFQLLNLFRKEGIINENDTVNEAKSAQFFTAQTAECLFDRFLCIPMIGGTETNIAIVFDGLDEVSTDQDNPMLAFLCSNLFSKLPPYLKIIITTRAEPAIMSSIQKNRPHVLNLNDADSDSDIRQYIEMRLSHMVDSAALSESEMNAMIERSNRMFLFAELICDTIADGSMTAHHITGLPDGIGGMFSSYFDRLFKTPEDYEKVRPFLRVLCAFDIGALSESFLVKVLATNFESVNRFYLSMRSFVQRRIIDGKAYIFFFHKALYDWLVDRSGNEKYVIDASAGVLKIAETVREIIANASEDDDYEFLKYAYRFTLAHSSSVNRLPDAGFLYILQLSAYSNSDLEIYTEVTRRIDSITMLTNDKKTYILSKLSLAGWYYDVSLEQDKALRLIESLYRDYTEEIKGDPELYTSAEINRIYITDSTIRDYKGEPEKHLDALKRHEETLEWEKALIQYILSCDSSALPSKGIKLAKAYYHKSLIEFRLEKYQDSIESAERGIDLADFAYKDPRRMKCLIYIIQGASCRKTGQHEKALEVLHKSLEYRLSLYGFYTLFTANSYHNLDDALYAQAIDTGSAFDPRLCEYLENYREIIQVVVGEKNPRMIHYYSTLANISDHNGEREKAIEYARKALEYTTEYYDGIPLSMKRIIEKYSG